MLLYIDDLFNPGGAMSGIVYPENWREICDTEDIFPDPEQPECDVEILHNGLRQAVIKSLGVIGHGRRIGLALSGGLDSSVLAVLLAERGVSFNALTIGRSKAHPDVFFAGKLAKAIDVLHAVGLVGGDPEDNYDSLFKHAATVGTKSVICGDTVDEMLGGYWLHQRPPESREQTFLQIWAELVNKHLEPLNDYATRYDISVALPYLAAFPFLRQVPMQLRADDNSRKIILRQLAKQLWVPRDIIDRPKIGLCSATEDRRMEEGQ